MGQIVSAVGGVLGGGGIVAWRNSKTDAGKLALEIAKDADRKADHAIAQLDEFRRRAVIHLRWDNQAAQQVRNLGGTIQDPPALL